jgi:hypothetical protein
MPAVSASYVFAANDPITADKLNQLGRPSVQLVSGEVGSTQLASNITLNGLTIAANTPFNGSYGTETFATTISLAFTTAKANTRRIACTSATAATINAATVPTAGHVCQLSFATDTTGGNVITFGTNFKSTGTYTLTGASKFFQIGFVSDGTNLCEIFRSGAAG